MLKPSNHLCSWCVAVALLIFLLPATLTSGQDSFTAIPPTEASRYKIDFARHFFISPEAEKADRVKLYDAVGQLQTLKGRVAASAENLERALRLSDQVQVQLRRHSAYLYLWNAVNTTDEASLAEDSSLYSDVNSRTAFLRQELMQLNDRQLAAFIARKASLKKYRFLIESVRRYRPHTLSLKEEEILSAAGTGDQWPSELYDKLRSQPQAIPAQRDLFAFALTRLSRARTHMAELHQFGDAASAAYFESYWSKAEVDELMEEVARRSELYRRYQRLRVHYLKKPASKERPPRYTIVQASEILRQALAPLGSEYGRELAALLDPANGRMDIVPAEHRRRGGFSQGFIGTDSVFYSAGFAGSYNDLRILAHESTHAVHRQLMNRSRVLPAYAEGPHYLFEAFAIFNEFLLPDYLYNHESDPLRRQFYLEQFLEGKGMIMFRVAPEVVLEHAVYEGVRNGTIKAADDLDALSERVFARYSSEQPDVLKTRWMSISLMYEDPFYDVNYVYGALLALKFYSMYQVDPEHFVPRYIALMKNGFDAPPGVLLKRYLDFDLTDPHLVENAVSVIRQKVDLLEKSYQK